MPRFVGLEKYRQSACERQGQGQVLTTQGICAGIDKVEDDIANGSNDWISALKDTPAYYSPDAGAASNSY